MWAQGQAQPDDLLRLWRHTGAHGASAPAGRSSKPGQLGAGCLGASQRLTVERHAGCGRILERGSLPSRPSSVIISRERRAVGTFWRAARSKGWPDLSARGATALGAAGLAASPAQYATARRTRQATPLAAALAALVTGVSRALFQSGRSARRAVETVEKSRCPNHCMREVQAGSIS